jgi:hypothetical protein
MARKATPKRQPQIGILGGYPPQQTLLQRPVTNNNQSFIRVVSPLGHYMVIDDPRPENWEAQVASVIDRIREGELELPGPGDIVVSIEEKEMAE